MDSRSNHYNGNVYGASRITEKVCDTTVSMNDLYTDLNEEIEVFPNPFSDYTTINYVNDSREDLTLIVYNIYGRSVRKEIMSMEVLVFKQESLQAGVYFFTLLNKQQELLGSGRLIIK
jgi:archaellum component FlaG (FlaF/FlaG flagellin family)